MKSTFLLSVGSILLMSANAHYFFDRLMVNGNWSEPWEYIRKISPQHTDNGNFITDYDYIIPVVDPTSLDLRCGRNASIAWSNPKVAIIHAGDRVGFAVNTTVGLPIEGATVMPWDRWPNLYHPGPATAWLSAAPGGLNEYTGDGDWFKILSVVGRTEQSEPPNDEYYWKHQWGAYQAKSWTFTIPEATPPGDYLLRFEHIYPLPVNSLQGSQFYANCAHIRVINDQTNIEIYFFVDVGDENYNISDFVEPKPAIEQAREGKRTPWHDLRSHSNIQG
ncbi:lytic polysaccharide monooxygenase [Amniculicola lignicola CBS 123094]|uniref:lytic cellulose monooxygenase (C4-dehydrogenating) n=1 Tax=Amniculicola lignicola CBS 123094 TaxID=1392246 RepID=A0A6A5X3K4_9PLEO|nr:lytic polysaccharide monooxygenase [Amniculicola lignicola CBS 123094]